MRLSYLTRSMFVAALVIAVGVATAMPTRQAVKPEEKKTARYAHLFMSSDPKWILESEIPVEFPKAEPGVISNEHAHHLPAELQNASGDSVMLWEVSAYPPGSKPTSEQRRAAENLVERSYQSAKRNGWFDFNKGKADGYVPSDMPHYGVASANGITAGNMEGKEARFGVGGSVLAAVVTSNGATGSYNSMHDSFQPLGVAVPLINMLLGEIVYGGLGTGLYSMIFVALVALFIGGLMVGRTPEHLGKQIGPPEMKIIAVYTLVGPVTVLALTALAVVTKAGCAGLTTNAGAHGFTEILFAYASAFANNGQSMAGLSANNIFYNITTIVAMLMGRYVLAVLALALAGRFATASRRAPSRGTVPTDGMTFGVLLTGTALLVGALNFLPALAIGPIAEHFLMRP